MNRIINPDVDTSLLSDLDDYYEPAEADEGWQYSCQPPPPWAEVPPDDDDCPF